MKTLKIVACVMVLGLVFPSISHAEATTKEVCKDVKDKKTGKTKQQCKKVKVHKKLEGTKVPDATKKKK